MEGVFYSFIFALLANLTWYSWKYGITPTPSSRKVINRIQKVLPPLIKGRIVELGSGWGTLAIFLARHFPLSQIDAYEISPIPFLVSKLAVFILSLKNVAFFREDIFKVSLKNASLTVCYLYPGAMIRLKEKFESELAPLSYVLSHTFAVPGWTPILIEYADDLYRTPIYLYQITYKREK